MRLEKLQLLREQKDSQERLIQSMVKIASKVVSDDDADDDGYSKYGRSRRATDGDDRRHSTDKSAEEKQLTYELNLRATSLMKSSLTKEEVTTYALSLEYGEHEGQLDELLAHLALTDEAVAEILEYRKNPMEKLTRQGKLAGVTPTYRDLYEKADRYVARCIVQCLNSTTPRVKKYRLDLREHVQGFRLSGLGILVTIHEFMKPKTGDDIQKIKDAWDKQEFFTVGMSADEVSVAAYKCRNAWKANRWVHDKMPYGYLRAIMSKVPEHSRSRALANEMASLEVLVKSGNVRVLDAAEEDRRVEHLLTILSMPYQPSRKNMPPWGRPAQRTLTASSTDTSTSTCTMGCCDDPDAHELDGCAADTEYLEACAASAMCWCCGKSTPEAHPLRKCIYKCKGCGIDFCPGTFQGPCPVIGRATLTQESVLNNAAGRSITPRMKKILIDKQAELRQKGNLGGGKYSRQAAEAELAAFAAERGYSREQMLHALDASVADTSEDEVHMTGGVLEKQAPTAEELSLIAPPPAPLDSAEATTRTVCPKATERLRGRKGKWISAMLDSGTNCNLMNIEGLSRYAVPGSVEPLTGVSINGQGAGQATSTTARMSLPLTFQNGSQLTMTKCYESPSSRKPLIYQNVLFAEYGLYVDMPTKSLKGFKDGSSVPLFTRGDHRLWIKFFIPAEDTTVEATSEETEYDSMPHGLDANCVDVDEGSVQLEANKASISTTATALLLAARFGVGSEGLRGLQSTVDGLPMLNVTPVTSRLIDADVHRRSSIKRRESAPDKNPLRTTRPGHTLAFDGKGPYAAPSVLHGHTYDMLCVDVASSESEVQGTVLHTGDEWFDFISKCVRMRRDDRGQKVAYVRFDRAGEFTSPAFVERVERELNVTVQFAPAKWHEGVAGPECNNDILTRLGEAMCARVHLGPKYLSVARRLASYLLNLRRRRGETKSRREAGGGTKPDMKTEMPYIFGSTVLVLRDKLDRGVPGSLDKGRTYEARYLGKWGAGHIVEKLDTGVIMYPHDCEPLNESELVRDSMPAAAALHSTDSQTDGADFPVIRLMPEVTTTARRTEKLAQDAYAVGDRLEISYKIDGKPTWFAATVSRVEKQGQRHVYEMAWDDARWAADPSWQNKLIDLQRADAPTHRVLTQRAHDGTTVALPPVGTTTPDGSGMTMFLPFGGGDLVIDSIKERTLARYPAAEVIITDAKNDKVNCDLSVLSIRTKFKARMQQAKPGKTVLFSATPCGSFSHCSGRRLRDKKKIFDGVPGLTPEEVAYLKRHNKFTLFTIECLEYCDAHGIDFGCECSPDRSDLDSDAGWKGFEDWPSFWDIPRVKDLIKRGAKTYLVARCRNEEPVTAQKYYQFMFSKGLQKAADEVLSHQLCQHTSHPTKLRGKTADGYWVSQQFEEYPPELCDKLAYVLCSGMIPDGQTPAEKPPFSATPRTPTPPAYLKQRSTAMTTIDEELDDAIFGYDGDVTALDALVADEEHTYECSEATVNPTMDEYVVLESMEVTAAVVAIKAAHPTFTRKQVHGMLTDHGALCTLSAVKKVRVGYGLAMDRERERAATLERAQQIARAINKRQQSSVIGERLSAAATMHDLEASKATQGMIEVDTAIGKRVYSVPTSAKQVMKSPEMMQWIEADQVALRALLVGGNELVRRDQVPEGAQIGFPVTARKIKVDQATGALEKFKSRHAYDGKRMRALLDRMGLPPPPTGTCNIVDDFTFKLMCGHMALNDRYFAKCDIGDAYTKGKRARTAGYMYLPDTCKQYDADGTPMVLKFLTPVWGEVEAGFEWDCELHNALCDIGCRQCEGVPAMYYFTELRADGTTADCRIVKIVDDLGFSESHPDQRITKAIIAALKKRYDGQVTSDLAPTSFAGYKIVVDRAASGTTVTLSQSQKIVEAVRKYMPEVLDGVVPTDVLTGTTMTKFLENLAMPSVKPSVLSKGQKTTQQITGDLKYFERGSCPRLSRMVHRLSCVMSNPPSDGLMAARSILYHAYLHKDDCLTFGKTGVTRAVPTDGKLTTILSDGAPDELEFSADASTSPHDIYSVMATYAGASVLHKTKKIGVAVSSTHDGENVATVKASEDAVYGLIVLMALGAPATAPVLLLTDNLANQKVSQNAQSATRSRYFLIRSACLHRRIADGQVSVVYVPDPENPADYLTKFIGAEKTAASIAYSAGGMRTSASDGEDVRKP